MTILWIDGAGANIINVLVLFTAYEGKFTGKSTDLLISCGMTKVCKSKLLALAPKRQIEKWKTKKGRK